MACLLSGPDVVGPVAPGLRTGQEDAAAGSARARGIGRGRRGGWPLADGVRRAQVEATPKIILEGTRLTLKTEIAFALNEHPRIVGPRKYRYHSPLISAEWCAFTPTSPGAAA